MRITILLGFCTLLAGCAGGGTAADQARNDHDLGVVGNAGLALTSQVRTDANNVDDILHRVGAATR